MTLSAMLAAYDDAALEAASSKGVMIRARKDAAAGLAELVSQNDDQALLKVAGEDVLLLAKGLAHARCSCPAAGTCRHIVTAILALRDLAPAVKATLESASPASFTLDEIEKFAGTDWPLALAMTEEPAALEQGATRSVTFPGTAESVTFPTGQKLRDALFKGPRVTRSRRVVAAAALLLAQADGVALPEYHGTEQAPQADPRLLDLVAGALEQAARALAAGQVTRAQDRLFSVAITSRAEAAPRLAATLRALSERLTPERQRQSRDRPEAVFGGLARAYALNAALRQAPDDPALLGQIARSYRPQGPQDLVLLGAEHWRNDSQARGFTIHLIDRATGRFLRVTEARAAGVDLAFSASGQWHAALWGLAATSGLMGHRLTIEDAVMADDGSLGRDQRARDHGRIHAGSLAGLALGGWDEIGVEIAKQLGRGLRRRAGEAMLLLAPKAALAPGFDPGRQRHFWDWQDDDGRLLRLTLPQDWHRTSLPPPELGLAALAPGQAPRLISVWLKGEARPRNLQFDLPHPGSREWSEWQRVSMPTAKTKGITTPPPDRLRLWLERLREALLLHLGQRAGHLPEALLAEGESMGLALIPARLRRAPVPLTPGAALELAYLAEAAQDLC